MPPETTCTPATSFGELNEIWMKLGRPNMVVRDVPGTRPLKVMVGLDGYVGIYPIVVAEAGDDLPGAFSAALGSYRAAVARLLEGRHG